MNIDQIGVGVDVESIDRFYGKNVLENTSFLRKIFTEREIEYCFSRSDPPSSLAVRFAGKEATIKAASHFGQCKMALCDIEIINNENGVPYVTLPEKFQNSICVTLSLSHSKILAIAFAVAIKK